MNFQPHQLKKAIAMHLPQAYEMIENPKSIEKLLLETQETLDDMDDFNEYTIALLEDVTHLIEMIKTHTEKRYLLAKDTLAMFLATLLYYVEKTDMVFDVIPYVGYADDAALTKYVLNQCQKEIDKYKAWKEYDFEKAGD